MGTGYTRNDSSNNIADGNVINASDLDGEFDAIVTAFSTSGHTHDGTAAEGGAITVMGPVQDFVVSATEIKPKTTNTLDIGTSLLQFKDIYIDGTAYLDTVDIDAGAIDGTTIGGTTPAAITATTLNATGGGSLTGTWSSLGTVTTVDINGGTIDGATIGGSSAAAITGTTITGTSFVSSGDMTFGDNNKAIFGAGSDLQIYHDGVTNNSYISELNPGGSLFIDGSNIFLRSSGGEEFFKAVANAQVEIYYDDAIKLSTTSTGIDVTGTVTADGLTVDSANSTFNGAVGITSAAGAAISEGILIDYSTNLARFLTYDSSTGSEIAMYTQPVSGSTTQRIRINSGGDISFYDSTGTSQNLFWDASASRLGIGTTSPDVPLEISVAGSSITNVLKLTTTGSGTVPAMQFEGDDAGVQHIIARIRAQQDNSSNGGIVFETEGSGSVAERMRIDSSGNVGIGTNSPTGKLSVSDPTYLSSAATLGSSITLNSENTASWLGTRELISFESVGNGADHRTGTLSVKLKKGASDTTLTEYMQINAVSNYTTFSTAAAERMRLDASGNLLVGTTDSNPASNNDTGGIALRETGQVNVSRDNNPPLQLNRKTGDGDIAVFQKNGTTVGSIGTYVGDLTIGDGDIGIRFDTGTGLIPWNVSTNAATNGTSDLGASTARFKDLYLSGTVNAATLSVDGGTIKLDGNYPVGTENVALGDTALDSITTGKWNVALGHAALTTATNSNQQTAIGRLALTTSNGSDNTAVGFNAANANTSGTSNTAIGAQALNSNTTASNLTAVGYQAGYSNTTGINLTAVGRQAAYSNTTGANNTAFGLNALYANTTGASNVSIGLQALDANTTGSSNTALGMDALGSNTTASNNTAVGYQAMYSNTTGAVNTAFGQQALKANTTAFNNSAFGSAALIANTTGQYNTGIGAQALVSNTTASNNTAVGYQAGYNLSTNSGNVFVGYLSGQATTSPQNTFIGSGSGYLVSSGQKNTIIGTYSGNQGGLDIRTSSNQIVLSDGDGNPRVHINSNGIAQTFLIGTTNTYNNVFNYVNGGAFQSTYADLIPTGNLSGNCTYLVTVIANLGGYPYYADTTFLLRTVPSTNGSGATSPIEFLTSSHVNSAALKWSIRTTSAASSTNGIQGLLSGGPSLSATNGVTCYAQRIA